MLKIFCPTHFFKATNFQKIDHGKNKRFDESGKPEESSRGNPQRPTARNPYLNITKRYWRPTPGDAVTWNIEHLQRLTVEASRQPQRIEYLVKHGWYQRRYERYGHKHREPRCELEQHFWRTGSHECQQSIKHFVKTRTTRWHAKKQKYNKQQEIIHY